MSFYLFYDYKLKVRKVVGKVYNNTEKKRKRKEYLQVCKKKIVKYDFQNHYRIVLNLYFLDYW